MAIAVSPNRGHAGGSLAGPSELRRLLSVLRRRLLLIALVTLAAVGGALAYSLTSDPVYRAEAAVLLAQQNLGRDVVSGQAGGGSTQDPDRVAQTQVEVARTTMLARRVLTSLNRTDLTPPELLAQIQILQYGTTDVLQFTIEQGSRTDAIALVNSYAEQFVAYRQELDTRSIQRARADLVKLLAELPSGSNLRDRLLEKRQELDTLAALQTANAQVIRAAEPGTTPKISPRPVRSAVVAFVLGLLAALAIALGRDALDTRLRTQEDIAHLLNLPALGVIPESRKRARHPLVMLDEPGSAAAEPFRLLRTNVEFVTADEPARMLLITSAGEREGKSTTAANLALAFARPGRDVVLVDLDLRRPSLAGMFGIEPERGLGDVALGRCGLEEALVDIPLGPEATGRLRLLAAGATGSAVGEFVAGRRLRTILAGLRGFAETIVIDTPPALTVGDALTISASVDAILVVARPRHLRRRMLSDLQGALRGSPARKLGFVVVGELEDASARGGYGRGYGDAYGGGNGSGSEAPARAGTPAA